jgi:hypothetical protein
VHSAANGSGGTEEVIFKPVNARYIRMQGTKRATEFGYSIYEMEVYGATRSDQELTPLHFIQLELHDAKGNLVSDNFYWRNGIKDLDYTALKTLPACDVSCVLKNKSLADGKTHLQILLKNNSSTIAFGNRLRLVNKSNQERILPLILSDNYVTLMPGEEKLISIEADLKLLQGGVDLLLKQYGHEEKRGLSAEF